jgi:hypothetical protein
MEIFVKLFDKTLCISIQKNSTVTSIKREILKQAGIENILELYKYPRGKTDCDLIHIRAGTKCLQNYDMISDYRIENNDTLYAWLPLLN